MRKARRLRVKVALRPRQRSRRNLVAVSVLSVAFLGAAALAALRHVAGELGSPMALAVKVKDSLTPGLLSLEVVGQPEDVRRSAQEFLDGRSLAPNAAAAALREKYPFMIVTVRRDWFRRSARIEFALRKAVAPAVLKSKPAGFLSDDGTVFSAPEGLYSVTAPVVEAAGADADALRAAAKVAVASREEGALPSPLRQLRWSGSGAGWEARLEDGTEILWGDGRWTGEKLRRLSEVLADARSQPQPAGRLAADLRYFEDGRVLLRPLPARAASLR